MTDSLTSTRQWLYNRRSELVGASGTQAHPYDYAYSYDSIGNRTAATENGASSTYAANNLNQYTAVNRTIGQSEQSNNFTYDADGNLTQDERFTYAYDDENRLVSVTPLNPQYGSRAIENAYDHRNRRIRKTVKEYDGVAWQIVETHTFVWDGWNIVFELISYANDTLSTVEYFWGNDFSGSEQGAGGVGGLLATRIDGVFYIPCYGSNGNIMMYVDATGTIAAQYDYDPYGNILQASGPLAPQFAFGFSTKYHDREVGLVAYQLRTYNPTYGRWFNRDPIAEVGGENLYGFVESNPICNVDCLGMVSWNIHVVKERRNLGPYGRPYPNLKRSEFDSVPEDLWKKFVEGTRFVLGHYTEECSFKVSCACDDGVWIPIDAVGEYYPIIEMRTTIFTPEIERRIRLSEKQHMNDMLMWLRRDGDKVLNDFLDFERIIIQVQKQIGRTDLLFKSQAECETKLAEKLKAEYLELARWQSRLSTAKWDSSRKHQIVVTEKDVVEWENSK